MRELRRVADLEGDLLLAGELAPGIVGDEIEAVHVDHLAVLRRRVVAVGHIDDVAANVLLDHEPGASAQSQAFALADGVKPVAVVLAHHLARLQLDDLARAPAQVTLDKLVVVDLAQEADALAILALGAGQPLRLGDGPHLALHEMADGKHQLLDLQARDLPQEIGLILDGILGRGEPHLPVDLGGRGVMARGNLVEILAPLLLEAAKLDKLVAHHVGVGRQATLDGVDRVAHHAIPILVVQRDDLEPAAILASDIRGDLDILLGRTVDVALLILHSDTDIEDRRVVARLLQQMYHYGAIHSARN